MWLRHGVDSWHLECRVTSEGHDFLASVTRKDGKLELVIPPSKMEVFESEETLNIYLKAIGLEEISLP